MDKLNRAVEALLQHKTITDAATALQVDPATAIPAYDLQALDDQGRGEFGRRCDRPCSSLGETFMSRNGWMSCCQQPPLAMEA